jgi:hypothetical protein
MLPGWHRLRTKRGQIMADSELLDKFIRFVRSLSDKETVEAALAIGGAAVTAGTALYAAWRLGKKSDKQPIVIGDPGPAAELRKQLQQAKKERDEAEVALQRAGADLAGVSAWARRATRRRAS